MEKMRQLITISKYCPKVLLLVAMKLYYPYMMKKWFRQYKNVAVCEDFNLIYGDQDRRKMINNGGTEIQMHVDGVLENKELDFKLEIYYSGIWLHVYTPRAIRETVALVPDKIDRSDYEKFSFGKLCPYSFERQRTSKEWKIRKEAILKHTPLKKPSDHILMMLQKIKYESSKWEVDQPIDIILFFNNLSLDMVCMTLFGSDFMESPLKCPYIDENNRTKNISLPQAILNISTDLDESYSYPISQHLPVINEKSLGNPYKRDKKNIEQTQKSLANYLKIKEISEEQVIEDYLNVIDAADDTLDICLVSCLFRLKQNSHVHRKLVEELKSCGITAAIDDISELTADKLSDCDYLTYVIKECLRMDPSSICTAPYMTYEDVEICGVRIPAKMNLVLNFIGCHYNSDQWHEPTRFIPERFDPSSEYFLKPGTGNHNKITVKMMLEIHWHS
ncbi:unnamed protein product [Moneuplotes crassus]|uniref:Cytochrome P450 n=1 Tax=Euplotes crassus TaxID=5936 RepID=A0AAD1XVK5_EUPCR|nr:unnamed protein product [Moneuplotes crassus]